MAKVSKKINRVIGRWRKTKSRRREEARGEEKEGWRRKVRKGEGEERNEERGEE